MKAGDPSYRMGAAGIHLPLEPVAHRDEEYEQFSFDLLLDIQKRHFWYRGRHRFLLHALRASLGSHPSGSGNLQAIDLGGGCGGWLEYLHRHDPGIFTELALADSSPRALELAGPGVSGFASRYQIDLLRLGWKERWDVAFLLDVLEHIPQDLDTLCEIREALRPGGMLFVTTPALMRFWTYNDEIVKHQRRYSRSDFLRLAEASGFELLRTRYFMFFLSPLLLASRLRRPPLARMTRAEVSQLIRRTHRLPPPWINSILGAIFAMESPLGWRLPFPWGTSVLGLFRKPV